VELAVLGLAVGGMLAWLNRPSSRPPQEPAVGWLITPAAADAAVLVGLLVAGLALIAGAGGGQAWITPEVLVGFVGGLANAWSLLIEIPR
jgi:hypothetical protein